jgi:Flp pilus assembly protein TadD
MKTYHTFHKILHLKLIGYLLLIGGLLSACATVSELPSAPADLRAEAEQALDEGDLATALSKLRQTYAFDPQNVETLRLLARLYDVSNSPADRQQVLQQIVTLDNANAFGFEQLGLLTLSSDNPTQAKTYLQIAHALEPERWMTLNGLGVIADAQELFEEAESFFNKALIIVPGHPQVIANLGWSKLLSGELEAAESLLKESLQIEPDSLTTRSNLAYSIALQGKYEEALALYESLYDKSVAANNVGYAALSRGDLRIARSYLGDAIDLNPSYYRKAVNNLSGVD